MCVEIWQIIYILSNSFEETKESFTQQATHEGLRPEMLKDSFNTVMSFDTPSMRLYGTEKNSKN